MAVGEWVSVGVAVGMGWYVQGFFYWNMNLDHTVSCTSSREFENSKFWTMIKIIIRKLEDRLIQNLKVEKFLWGEPIFDFYTTGNDTEKFDDYRNFFRNNYISH